MVLKHSTHNRDMIENSTNLTVVRKAGGSIINSPGVFSVDSKFLFLACGNSIRSYSTETGEFITSYEGLEKDAIGVSLHPSDSSKIVSMSCEGELIVWQYAEVNHQFPMKYKIMLGSSEDKLKFLSFSIIKQDDDDEKPYVVCVATNQYNTTRVRTYCAVTGEDDPLFPDIRVADHSRSMSVRHNNKETLLAAISYDRIYIYIKQKTDDGVINTNKSMSSMIKFTFVTCHPSELCVLAGDEIGNIRYYQGLHKEDKLEYASYHWHTLPIENAVFSNSGTHFFSGGGECTLVRWLSPTVKYFLPRLPAEIMWLAVSPENSIIAVSTKDNAIQLVNAAFEVKNTIQHFSWSKLPYNATPNEMTFDPRSKTLVMNARVGYIQFFSLEQGGITYLLDITCRNYLTQERKLLIKNVEVTKFAFNADGSWLATVEFCEGDSELPIEVRLKFWEFNKVKQIYELNTSAENPHNGKINAVVFRPSTNNDALICITTGEDKKFRTWILEENTTIYDENPNINQQNSLWRPSACRSYHDLPARALSFSVDGSLMAVTFGPTLTVWVPGINQLKCSLTPANAKGELTHVEFGQKSVHLVVTGSCQGLAVWNILSLSLVWVTHFNLCKLVRDPESDVMAAVSSTNDVVIFTPNNHEPIFHQNQILPVCDCRITNAAFVPHLNTTSKGVSWQRSSQLYFFSSKQELLCFENPLQDDTTREGQNLDTMPATSFRPPSAYSAILAEQIQSDIIETPKEPQLHLGTPGLKTLQDFMEGPAHTMPPLSFLAGSLLFSFIAAKDEDISDHPRGWKFSISEPKVESSDDSDSETKIQPRTQPKELKSDLLSPESGTLADIEKRLTKIESLPLDWVSELLPRKV